MWGLAVQTGLAKKDVGLSSQAGVGGKGRGGISVMPTGTPHPWRQAEAVAQGFGS